MITLLINLQVLLQFQKNVGEIFLEWNREKRPIFLLANKAASSSENTSLNDTLRINKSP